MKHLHWMAGLCLAAAPAWGHAGDDGYVDPRGRFRVSVPKEWQWQPRFGDLDGARFVRQDGDATLSVEVRVGAGPRAGRVRWRRAFDGRPVVFRSERHGARATWTYELTKGRSAVHLVASGRATRLAIHRAAIESMVKSLRLGAAEHGASSTVRVKDSSSAPPTKAAALARPTGTTERSLAGTWRWASGDGALRLVLLPDGRFRLKDWRGTWRASGDHLLLQEDGGARIEYRYRWVGERLRLSGADLDVATHWQRVAPGGGAR